MTEDTSHDHEDWESRERLLDIVGEAPLLVFALDLAGVIRVSTGGGLAKLGITPGALVGASIFDLYQDRPDLHVAYHRALSGERFTVVEELAGRTYETTYTPTYDAQRTLIGTLGISVDVTDRVEVQKSLRRLAEVDTVTGLRSRQSAEVELSEAIAAGDRLALLLIDLDDFKDVNDSHGHALGDLVLRRLDERLRGTLADGATIARMGGDELMVTVPGEDVEEISRIADELLATLAMPLRIDVSVFAQDEGAEADQIDVAITASMGIALAPRDGDSATALLARADSAMYAAKQSGGATHRFYDVRNDGARRRLAVATRLRRAVARQEIYPAFQPLQLLRSGRVVGFEALARWCDPELGQVSPAEFITLAERSPLIDDLFEQILHQSMAAAAEWTTVAGASFQMLSINVAARQLRDIGLAKQIADVANHHRLPLDRLHVELTETAVMDDDDKAHQTLQQMSDAGVAIYIDDFGVGYSNIGRLTDLSAAGILDGVKIDRRFVAEPDNGRDVSLLRLFQRMGDAFGVDTVLEGIETESQLQVAIDLGYRLGQGWHLGRPMTADAARDLIAGGRPSPASRSDSTRARPAG
ncbi:putative bifunctional diguanylate cyclase/phosphodiesterase [Skermania piniformis]|uniref:EAL domain-containing protein n=1 Tax=Skermania pinensis TaxID=39122 RepID=A0ABX8S848_9ACTN|nr:EAL domain-containing protein [Skermania piniformis]QXQ14020.1 EAL domain-containing protein [Skermania piniformis]